MIKSRIDNLFNSIFPCERESASLIIKFLLVLETEKLIPLFDINDDKSGIEATVNNRDGEMLLVKDIIKQSQGKNNLPSLFFGSNFQIRLSQRGRLGVVNNLTWTTFLIFTQEGLILENKEQYLGFLPHDGQNDYTQLSDKYSFIPWEYWQNISLIFAQDKPECRLRLNQNKSHYLEINIKNNYNNEAEQIENQLPLIFAYFILKRFWQYVEKFRHQSYVMFNPDDFLYLDCDRISYFMNNVLKNIDIKEKDLDILIRNL